VEAAELAESAGLVLDPWEADVLVDTLGERPDGKWAAFEVGLVVPRQNGKGSILEARELAGLFLFDERLILHSAHEFKTAQEAFRRILQLVESTPDLERKVFRVRTSHGEEGIELKTRQRLRFVARSTGSGRGFTGDTVILDEAYNLSAEAMSALLPTMAARPNPQLWYTSSAPLPRVESDMLRRLCKRGRAGESARLAYIEYCAASDADITDPVVWAGANPGFGIRISEEFIAAELEALGPDDFTRERLGIWHDNDNGDQVIPAEKWAACRDPKSGPVGGLSFALDVAPDRGSASIAVAGRSGRGGIHVEVIDHRPGTSWLAGRALEVQEKWGGKVAIAVGSPAWSLETDLVEAGVELEPVSTVEHSQACGGLFDDIVDGRLRQIGQPELDAAVDGADRRNYGDAWLWSRRTSIADISPLVAVTLARWAHTQDVTYDALDSVW
jgi:phage terminase large subunit-like protein